MLKRLPMKLVRRRRLSGMDLVKGIRVGRTIIDRDVGKKMVRGAWGKK